MGDAHQACRHCRQHRRIIPRPLRPARRGRRRPRRQRGGARRANRRGAAGRRQPGRGPHPAPFRQRGAVGDSQQLLPDRRARPAQADHLAQVRERQAHRHSAAASALRNLRLFAAGGRRAPALRQGGARRHPLVGPAAGLPHRGPGSREGAAGQERGDRAGRRQGRLRAQADAARGAARGGAGRGRRHLQAVHLQPARHHRQYFPRRRHHSAARRGAARGRRSLSGGGRRQGHRHLLRHRQRDRYRPRLLAGRRFRLGRLRRLRPQGHGHHRARRLGVGQAPFPRDGRQHPRDAVQRGRRRRHVGRRVRQRHAARDHHQAAGGLRPSRYFHRSRSRSENELRRARAAVQTAALELAGLRQDVDFQGRRRFPTRLEIDRAVGRKRRRCSASAPASRRSS